MMVTIDLRSRVPIYEQIKNQILELILLGVLKPHDQLPSIRALALDLKLNVNTVKRAFQDLEAAGVTYTLPGRGSFIAENALENNQLKGKALQEIRDAVLSGRANGIEKDEILALVESIYQDEK